MARTTADHRHHLFSLRPRAVPVRAVNAIVAAAALAGLVVTGGSAAASTTAAGRAVVSAGQEGSTGELVYLIRLARNAQPDSAAHFRLIEEIDGVVW